jgi:CHASE2 domain-containing sensor protein
MSDGDTEDATSQRGRFRAAAERSWHWLLVTVGARSDAHREVIRALLLASVVGTVFALSGAIKEFAAASLFVKSPIDLDHSLRALSLGWFGTDRTIPITIVDIDENTNRAWNSPAITPRDKLARMLEVVTAANPIAVIVDIDLSWGDQPNAAVDAGQRELLEFLQHYSGAAPLIFPKRIQPSPDGTQRLAASPFDDVFEKNSRLSWAHASFETDAGGAVRNWHEWLEVCTGSGAEWLPSVPVRLAAVVEPLPRGLDRPDMVTHDATCAPASGGSARKPKRLFIGPRLTGEGRTPRAADAQAIPASLLLEAEIVRNDARLFGGRVVFIGATHASAGDFWLTPSGVLPGVELLANVVRFAPLQVENQGGPAQLAYRSTALLLFVVFACLQWWLRGLAALVVATIFTLVVVAVAIERYDNFGVFDAVEAAILLMVAYKALEFVFKYIDDVKTARARLAPGRWRWLRTLRAAFVREHEPGPGGRLR